MATEEEIITMLFSRWVTSSYPLVQELFTHFPAGGYRHISTGRLLMDMGTKTGYPDMLFFMPKGRHHGLMIEIKTEKGRVSGSQKLRIPQLRAQGYAVAVCYGLEECKDVFTAYMEGRSRDVEKQLTTMSSGDRRAFNQSLEP